MANWMFGKRLYEFCTVNNGFFCRGVYCAVSIASMLHIVTDELFEGIEDYIGR